MASVGLLILIAFAVRSVSLDAQSLWRDEVDALRFAIAPWSEMLSNFTHPGWNGPLYFLLLRAWVALTGTSEYALRFFSLIFGVLCLPLIYVLGRRLFGRLGGRGRPFLEGRLVGLFAVILATGSAYLTWYGQEVKMYTLVPALALLAIYGLRRAVEGGGWRWWVVHVIASTLAFYAHILAALLIPVYVLLYVVWWPEARKRWIGAIVSFACLTLPYLPLAAWQIPLTLQSRETGFHPYAMHEMVEILLNGWSLGILGLGRPWGTALMVALAVWGLISPVTSRTLPPTVCGRLRPGQEGPGPFKEAAAPAQPAARLWSAELGTRLALVCWLVAPLSIVWFISLRQPLFTDRYLIWSTPAFYLLVARGLASLWCFDGWGRWAAGLLLSAILALNGTNLWHQATVPIKSDFRAAAAYIADYQVPVVPAAPAVLTADVDSDAQTDAADRRRSDAMSATSAASVDDTEWAFKCYVPLVLVDVDVDPDARCARDRECRFGMALSGAMSDELVIFQIPYGRYTFDYYFPTWKYPWAEGLYTNHRAPDGSYLMSEQESADRMREMTEGYDVVWLVATETAMWDERGLVQAWLETNTQRVDEAHFAQVDVYRYAR